MKQWIQIFLITNQLFSLGPSAGKTTAPSILKPKQRRETKMTNVDASAKELMSSPASGSIERDAESFLQHLNAVIVEAGSIDLKEFRNHYESLFVALKQAHAREIGLVDKYQELTIRHDTTVAHLETAQSSNKCIAGKIEILQASIESANARECRGSATIRKLEDELQSVTSRLAAADVAIACRDNEAKLLFCDVAEWKQRAATAEERIITLEMECQKVKSQVEQLQISQRDLLESNCILNERITEKNNEIARENERRDHIQREFDSIQSKLQFKVQECIDLQYASSVCQSKAEAIETSLVEAKKIAVLKEQDLEREKALSEKLARAKSDQKKTISVQAEKISQLQCETNKMLEDHSRIMSEKAQLERNLEVEHQAVLRLEKVVDDANAAIRLSNDEAALLTKEVGQLRVKDENASKELAMLKREMDLLEDRMRTSEYMVTKANMEIQEKDDRLESMEQKLALSRDAITQQESLYRSVEEECISLRRQGEDLQLTRQRLSDELTTMADQTKQLTSKITEKQSEVDVTMKENESIRNELNFALKDLADTKKSLLDAEQEKESEHRLTDALRSDLSMKDLELQHVQNAYRGENSLNKLYTDEISTLKNILSENEERLQTHQVEALRLNTAIREIEETAMAQTKECDRVLNERDILGSSLIRRNDELALLYEKIKILNNNRCRGEQQYNARLDDIRLLKIKIRELQKRTTTSASGQAGVEDLSRKLMLVEKELIREQLKVKALSDELENPINVHRWHTLEGADPEAFDMIQKIQILQKRLLQKTEEVMMKNSVIRELEQQQIEMKQVVARRPGPEIVEQLHNYQQDVTKKVKQMKAMAGELNMNKTEVSAA